MRADHRGDRARRGFEEKPDWRERLRRVSRETAGSEWGEALHPSDAWSRFLRPQDLRKFGNLLFAAKLVVEGFYAGRHRSPYHDFSAEFADYRAYVPGDEIRAVDWKAVARTDRLYVKLFRKETDMSAYLVLDKSASMGYSGPDGVTKYEYGAYAAAALSYLMLRQGDKPSVSLCDDTIRSFLPPRGTLRHLHGILHGLERTQPSGPTSVAHALRVLFPLAKRRGLLVVISDFLEDPDGIFDALAMYRHRGFAVLLLQVLTEDELHLPNLGAARFTDPEGPGALNLHPEAIRSAYEQALGAHLDALRMGAKARAIRFEQMTTSTPYYEALSAYLSSRA